MRRRIGRRRFDWLGLRPFGFFLERGMRNASVAPHDARGRTITP